MVCVELDDALRSIFDIVVGVDQPFSLKFQLFHHRLLVPVVRRGPLLTLLVRLGDLVLVQRLALVLVAERGGIGGRGREGG